MEVTLLEVGLMEVGLVEVCLVPGGGGPGGGGPGGGGPGAWWRDWHLCPFPLNDSLCINSISTAYYMFFTRCLGDNW